MRVSAAVVLFGSVLASACGSVAEDPDAARSIDAASVFDAAGEVIDATPPECTDPGDCDDGLYCNGVERCLDDSCEPAVAGVDCSDGVDCTDDTCDDDLADCVHVPNHSLCTSPGAPFCDPAAGCRDVPCIDPDECDDDVFCNGPEVCDIPGGEKVGSCKSGSPPFCDDTIDCTIDVCDPGTDACKFAPDHALCQDSSFCNGMEICDTGSGCIDGPDPDLSDGVACTVDTCIEGGDPIVHVPDDALCDDGLYCSGPETCDPASGCQIGLDVDCGPDDACGMDKTCDFAPDKCVETPVTYSMSWAMIGTGGTTITGIEPMLCGDSVVVFSESGVCTTPYQFLCSIDLSGNAIATARPAPGDFSCPVSPGAPDVPGCSKATINLAVGSAWLELHCCL